MVPRMVIALVACAAPGAVCAATFTVNSVADASDSAPGDGLCAGADGACTLRAAIEEANALPGPDAVTLQAEKYKVRAGEIAITSDVTITGPGADGCIVRGNRTTRIFYVDSSANVALSGVGIERGRAEHGGAILNDGFLQLTQAAVRHNHASQLDGGLGGGIYNNGILELTNVTLDSNRATGHFGGFGGSLYNNGSAVLRNIQVSRSHAAGCGGGIYNNGGSIEVTNATVERNRVTNSGGGLFHQGGSMTLTNVVICRNRAGAIGGGVFTYGTLRLLNVTISKNRSYSGGGLFSRLTPVADLMNVTITSNQAHEGAGILNNGTVTLKNTIVAENSPRNCEGSPVTSGGYNLAGDATCTLTASGDLTTTDPRLSPLIDDGSGIMTQALLPGSPAIDAGDDSGCPATDQRGLPRPTDGNGDSMATCDIGAYELQP